MTLMTEEGRVREDGILPPLGHWWSHGACRRMDTNEFFHDGGNTPAWVVTLCATCPVREPCLEYALREMPEGYWGGTSKRQRHRIRAARRQSEEIVGVANVTIIQPRTIVQPCPCCGSANAVVPDRQNQLRCLECECSWPRVTVAS